MTGRHDTLQEVPEVRQIPGAERRRWFVSRDLDLLVWFSTNDEIYGFQLRSGEGESEEALTWMADRGFLLSRVDDGEGVGAGKPKKTPMLVEGGQDGCRGVVVEVCCAKRGDGR